MDHPFFRLTVPLLALCAACSDDPTAPTADLGAPDRGAPDARAPDSAAADLLAVDLPQMDGPTSDLGPVTGHTWVTVQAGTFTMGSPASESCREPDVVKETQHQVTLTRSFRLSATEVTQGQFRLLMGYNPSKARSCGKACPVEYVSWHEAAAYCNALSVKEGLTPCYACKGSGGGVQCDKAGAYADGKIMSCPGYRLPTEAEWEYAYRAGTTGSTYVGEIKSCSTPDTVADKLGWYKTNSGGKLHPVGQMPKNPWGLWDMAGNVWEWTSDYLQVDLGSAAVTDPFGAVKHSYRVIRGGGWFGFSKNLRAAHRFQKDPTYRCHGIGLRVAQTL